MMIVRQVCIDDLDSLWELIGHATVGLTTLSIDREQLADRVERSQFAFRRKTEKAEGAPYVFVMEETETNQLVGTSCIFSKTGGYEPFYGYRLVSEIHRNELLDRTLEIRSLHLVKIHNGPTEIGSLFLLPAFRKHGRGKLLSMARFLYMALHPKRFATETIAEMRGFLCPDGTSPFWNAIGAHFFQIEFPQADSLSMIDKQFIEDLMPRYPIYWELLPQPAIDAIGNVHEQTRPALAMLEAQGFQRNGLVDIFDGGPVVQCATQKISAVASAKILKVIPGATRGPDGRNRSDVLIATATGPFRAAQANAIVDDSTIQLLDADCVSLELVHGDSVICISRP